MKDLLKNFKIQQTLNQLSDSTIDLLITKLCDEPKPDLAAIRKDKKKRDKAQAIAEVMSDQPRCVRALRVAYFFHNNRNAFTGLRPFLSAHHGITIDWAKIEGGKSAAEQALLLYIEQETHVAGYFVICLHTQQSATYCSCRIDYADGSVKTPDSTALDALKTKLLTSLHRDRGSQFSDARSFSHDGKTFLMLEFDDLPSHQREYIKGQDKPVDKYPRLALGLAYVFDTRNNTIDTIAETPEIRLLMHQVCAEVIYGKTVIPERPPKNETFDLEALLDAVTNGTPLAQPNSSTGVRQIFVSSLRLQRTKHPFWETTANIKMPKKHLEQQRDWVQEIQNCVNSRINTKSEPGSWWHRSYVEATQADLFAVYWDSTQNKEVSEKITVNSSGGTSLGHDGQHETIKQFLRELGLLKQYEQINPQIENDYDAEQQATAALSAEPA